MNQGQTVDVGIWERSNYSLLLCPRSEFQHFFSMLNITEGMIPEYDRKGKVRYTTTIAKCLTYPIMHRFAAHLAPRSPESYRPMLILVFRPLHRLPGR